VTYPAPGKIAELSKLLIGMHDYGTGLDLESFRVIADFPLDGLEPGANLASKFAAYSDGVWSWKLTKPLSSLPSGTLTVEVRDQQGNTTRIERTFSVGN
jgi:hypothetical protein